MLTCFWILSGTDYIDEARVSALSVRQVMPDVWRVLFTPDPGVKGGQAFQAVAELPARSSPYWYLDCTRYLGAALAWLDKQNAERLVYLDSDTYAALPFGEIFDLLDRFDLAGAHAPGRQTCSTARPVPASFPELNIGVLGLRNTPSLRHFAAAWLRKYCQHQDVYKNNDQGALRECLWEYVRDINLLDTFTFAVLPPEFNCRPVGAGAFLSGPLRILHTRGALADRERMVADANRITGARLWKP